MKVIDLGNRVIFTNTIEAIYENEYADVYYIETSRGDYKVSSKIYNKVKEYLLSLNDDTKDDKKIEKLDLEDDGNTITLFGKKENEWTILDNVDIIVCNKINEIIDKINRE